MIFSAWVVILIIVDKLCKLQRDGKLQADVERNPPNIIPNNDYSIMSDDLEGHEPVS